MTQSNARRVLLVNGEWQASVGRAEALVLQGWEVHVATSAEDALASVNRSPPYAVVAAARLPGVLDGHELARRVRSDPHTRRVPVIVLTESSDPAMSRAPSRFDRATYLAVSCPEGQLVNALEREMALAELLASRRALREARPEPPAPGDAEGRAPRDGA